MKRSLKTTTLNFFRLLFKAPALERLLLKFTIGKPYTSSWAKLIPNNYQYKPHSWRIARRNGLNYKLDLHDYIDWFIYFGLTERSRQKLYSLAGKDAVVIDVGTNMGETLMNFSRITGSKGQVHGFEPDSTNHSRCMANLGLNDLKNVSLNKVGLGNVAGEFKIKVSTPSNRGGNKIIHTDDGSAENITVTTLDNYVEERSLGKIDLVKIDVEGFEYNVLQGAKNSLIKFRPILFIELDDDNLREQGASAQILVTFLEEIGYFITNADDDTRVDRNISFENCHYDIICKFT